VKAILRPKKYDYVKRTVILLIMVTLVAGMLDCTLAQYTLRIDITEGGVVTHPGEGTFDRIEETEVPLVAKPDDGYRFVNWTGDVDTIANVTAASTSITMNGHYSIIANFEVETIKIEDWYGLNTTRYNLGTNYILVNDLTRTTVGYNETASDTANEGKGWDPVGTRRSPFSGSFDGRGHKIEGLFTKRSDKDYVGLFGYVDDDGVVENISVVNATVAGRNYVGGLVGRSEAGNVSNSYSTGTVTGVSYVGGLVGLNQGIVEMSYSQGSVNGSAEHVGGLVGWNGGSVSNSNSGGNVAGSGDNVGGLVGRNYEESTVSDSYSTGNVTGKNYVGGLVGWNEGGDVTNSYSTGSVTGSSSVGGLVGRTDEESSVSNSYSTGNVTGDEYVGGLVGCNYEESTVSNSYSTGNVTGNWAVGGLVGFNYKSTIRNSHYNYDQVLINGQNLITTGALFGEDFEQWLANDKFLDVNERLSQEDDYYMVNNVTDFKELLAFGQNDSLKFKLTNDLDLGNEPNFYIPYFAGELDGNSHNVSNLSVKSGFAYNVGLFGCIAPGGRATEVGVEDVDITGGSYVGGLVGSNWEGDVSDSYSTGSVSGYDYVGGLAGRNDAATIERCNSRVSVNGNSHVGGLVGRNDKEGTVEDSYSTGAVAGNSSVGGVAGSNGGTVRKSCSGSNVTGSKQYVGGLVGSNEATVEESCSTGSVSGKDYVGGLMGHNGYLASNSYSTGNVSGSNWVGGLVGQNTPTGAVNRCYSAGKVTGKQWVGGLVGQNSQGGDVTRSFWDTDSSGQVSSAGGSGKNTTQMKNSANFTGWGIIAVVDREVPNIAYVWNIVEGETYPFLSHCDFCTASAL
jgi:hypothetical protein